MAIRIICVGKKHEAWVTPAIERYQKRLKRPYEIEWVFLPHSSQEGTRARQEESERILSRLRSDDYVIVLDERGQPLTSPQLAETISYPLLHSKAPVLVIGGAYGVDQSLRDRANLVWSLSGLVFPHQLVRLIATEQLYRAQEIISGKPYHHE